MQISKLQLEKFKQLYVKRFGIELSAEEVHSKALSLVNLVRLAHSPIKDEQLRINNNATK